MNLTLKKTIKRALIFTLSIFFVLFFVLIYHLYQVTHKPEYKDQGLQMARINFKSNIDSIKANEIRSDVNKISGVNYSYMNVADDILVYSFNPKVQNSLNVYSIIKNKFEFEMERYIVTPEQANTGCPVLNDKNSFRSKLVNILAKL